MSKAKVLNGNIKVGDRVAVAVNSSSGGQRAGEVLDIRRTEWMGFSGLREIVEVKVRVDWSSGTHYGRNGKPPLPYVKTYGDPLRMVRL